MKTLAVATLGTMLWLLAGGEVRAQTPPAPAAPAAPGSAVPAPGAPAPAPGMRVATGQASVVGGNSAAARERALDDAVKRAVDAAITDVTDPATRAAQAKSVKAILARARSFVPRYRALEEGEADGQYSIRIEAEVDEVALRAKLERPGGPVSAAPVKAGTPQVVVLAGDKTEASTALAAAVVSALGTAALRVRAAAAAGPGEIPLRVTAEVVSEGPLRGIGRTSVLCRGTARTGAPPAGPAAELEGSERIFVTAGADERPEAVRAECGARLAASFAGRIAVALASTGGVSGGGDLRPVTVEADVEEPAAVPALLRGLRSVGAVSSVELTRVAGGRADLRVRTRAPAATLASALSRDVGSVITLSDVQVSGDVIHLRARMRTQPAAPGGSAGGSP